MLDAIILPLITDEERKRQEKNGSWRQPSLPVPDRRPYVPLIREGSETPQRGYYDSGEDRGDVWNGCVIEMSSVQKERYKV